MQQLIQDLRYALRTMRRDAGFTTVAILALAIGIGANTAVFTVVNGVLLRPLPFPEPDRLLLISHAPAKGPFGAMFGMGEGAYLNFGKSTRSFEGIAAFDQTTVGLAGVGEPVRLPAASIAPEFLGVVGLQPSMGRGFVPGEREPVVLIGERLWRGRFGGDPAIVGRTVKLDGKPTTIVGVMPAGFSFPYEVEMWTPLTVREQPHRGTFRPVVGRLRRGVTAAQAKAELETVQDPLAARGRDRLVSQVAPLNDLMVKEVRPSLLIFAGAVAFVLLIACANVANLMLTRAASRRQEIAVRAAMGASRGRLIRQLLTESLTMALAGGAAGVLVALWGVPALLAMAPEGRIPRTEMVRVDGNVLAFTLAVSIVTGLLFGLAPAFQATGGKLREALGRGGRATGWRMERLRSGLVVAEVALALVLLAGAGLMVKSFLRMRAVNPGFRPENVLTMTVRLPESVYREGAAMKEFHGRILEKIASVPGVTASGGVNWLPLGGRLAVGDFQIEGGKFPDDYFVDKLVTTPGYPRAMGIRLVSGRDFSARDTAEAPAVAMVSQSVARRLWPEGALGKRISEKDEPGPKDWATIVGVVEDVHQLGLTRAAGGALYFSYLQAPHENAWLDEMSYVARTVGDPRSLTSSMRAILRDVDPDQPVQSLTTLQDVVAKTIAEPEFEAQLLLAFSILAVALAAIGIYGVLAYTVSERTREIGIRMALGAEAGDVIRMVLRRTLLLAGFGVALGTAGAMAATRVLASVLFQVKPTDGVTFASVAGLLTAVALLAGWIPARHAARVNPLEAMRWE